MAIAFGAVLRKYRRERGFSQDMLAMRCDLDRTYPSLLERGLRTPSLTVIFKLADGLDVAPSIMMKETMARLGTDPGKN